MPAKTTLPEQKYLRKVKSFVLREGRLTRSQNAALENHWADYGLSLDDGLLDAEAIKQNREKLVLEIGFGMGKSLCKMAENAPNTQFIGIEVHRPGVGALIAKALEANVHNLKIYCHDAIEVLEQCIQDNAIDTLQVFFPDPWPKKKHHKRRIIQPAFIDLIRPKLKPNGLLHVATDWEPYAMHIMEVMLAAEGFSNAAGGSDFSPRPEDRPLTKYEQRGQRLGHGVWDICFTKMGD